MAIQPLAREKNGLMVALVENNEIFRNIPISDSFSCQCVTTNVLLGSIVIMGNKRKALKKHRPLKRVFHSNQFRAASSSTSLLSEPDNMLNIVDDSDVFVDLSDNDVSSQDEATSSESDASSDECDKEETAGSRVVNLACLQQLISRSSVCSSCRHGNLNLEEVERHGLASVLSLACLHCGAEETEAMAEQSMQRKFYDINRKSVLAMRAVGKGREALQKICGILDVAPPVSKHSYLTHCESLHSAAKQVALESMGDAAKLLVEDKGDDSGAPVDIAVTTDGTWMRRGFTSLYGVQTLISWDTGKVLDVDVLSKYCPMCESWPAKKNQGSITAAAYDAWHLDHEPSCQINTNVSSPSMETEAVKRIWSRSLEQHNLRYTTYIGDGDSKGHSAVREMAVYGNIEVTKEECVGHIQKRVGKNLRDLKQRLGSPKLSDGKAIGGRGRLTDAMINSLQNYYGRAVRDHRGSVTDMARAIWASFCHTFSTDESPHHDFCPEGSDSWCRWQASQVTGEPFSHKYNLSTAIKNQVKPLYIRVSEKPLLERCKLGATQNANECLNGLIWQLCPKQSFCTVKTVETATSLSVIIFNDGYRKVDAVLEKMGCRTGTVTRQALAQLDCVKAYHKRRKSSAEEQHARKKRRAVKKGYTDSALEKEGVTYCAGGF